MAIRRSWHWSIQTRWTWGILGGLAACVAARAELSAQVAQGPSADTISAPVGSIEIRPFGHASVQVVYEGHVIHVDPWRAAKYVNASPADLILITDIPGDHLDLEAIRTIRKPGAPVVVPPSARDSLPDGTVLGNGETVTLLGLRLEAVPSYDLTPGEPFHPKGRGNGYVMTLGVTRIYFSGGGLECTPEIEALPQIDIAFIAMNLPNDRMTPTRAAECVKAFNPRIVYPYHYRDADLEAFRSALEGLPIDVRLATWY